MNDRTLLIANGDGAAGALRAAGLAGEAPEAGKAEKNFESSDGPPVLVLRDVLSCGGLRDAPLTRDLHEWHGAREEFWRRVWTHGLHWGRLDEHFGSVALLPANLYHEAEAMERADTVIACVGAGLSDQLMLAFLVTWVEHLDLDAGRLQVASYLEAPGAVQAAPPAGLPRLGPRDLAAAWSPRPLSDEERVRLRAFWSDYVAADNAARECWCPSGERDERGDCPKLLVTARSAWASRRPAPPHHLAAWDRALLEAAADGERPLGAVLGRALRSEDVQGDPVGDLVLLHRIVMLSEPSAGPAWWNLGTPRGPETSCALTGYGSALLQDGAAAARDARTLDWLWGLAPPPG